MASSVASAILAHARETAPEECCGLLVGRGDRVERAVPTPNLRASRDRYLGDPAERFAARRSAGAEGLAVAGASPSPPQGSLQPSAGDLAEAFEIGFVYVIAGPASAGCRGDVAAYRFTGSGFEALGLAIEPD